MIVTVAPPRAHAVHRKLYALRRATPLPACFKLAEMGTDLIKYVFKRALRYLLL